MADILTQNDQEEKNKEINDLTAQAATEQYSDVSNDAYEEGAVTEPAESNAAEDYERTEADVIPEEDVKEEAAEDVRQNNESIAADSNEQEGSGAFETARRSWANGWTV